METLIAILIIAVVVVLLLHPGVKPVKPHEKRKFHNPGKDQPDSK
jgi:hypothetical protein